MEYLPPAPPLTLQELDAAESLASLAAPTDPLQASSPTLAAYDIFSKNPTLYALAVVDERQKPIGILNRFKFLEALSKPYGRDLLTQKPVTVVMDRSPLVVDEHMLPEHLGSILMSDESRYIFDGFIVTREGAYLGIGTGYGLVKRLTDRRQATLFHMAHHDALTDLPNRQLFRDRLTQAVNAARRRQGHLAVLYLDIDRFKSVNDTLGHALGDRLLQSIAERMRRIGRAQDTIARLSGDEFAVILTSLPEPAAAEVVARKIIAAVQETHPLDHHEVHVSCSVGIAMFPTDATTPEGLLQAADAAGYHAKMFRNTFRRYSSETEPVRPGRPVGVSTVRRAIEARDLAVHYQPQLCLRTRRVTGLEALVRWSGTEKGAVSTSELIRIAEDSGLTAAIFDFVLGTAMDQVMAWKRLPHLSSIALAVNLSAAQLRDHTVVTVVERYLRETGFPPADLELEITETAAMLSDTSGAVLAALKALGIRLSIDDFGTGYSSLGRLQRLPVDALKIDRTFVSGIEGRDAGALAQAIILMAHSLGLMVTGEGVETPRQLAFLEQHGCDRVQGFLTGAPQAPSVLELQLCDVSYDWFLAGAKNQSIMCVPG